jgi:cGMP-dependent protein kinase
MFSSEIKKVNFQRRSQLMELKSFAEKYELGSLEAVKKLGEGQFGTVLLVRDRDNSKPYALKCVAKQ